MHALLVHARGIDIAKETSHMQMAPKAARWTLAELHRLPDDGNRYELVRGDLFVTPPPAPDHEHIVAVLSAVLQPYVERTRLGRLYHPRSIVQAAGSQAEPDLMVRAVAATRAKSWHAMPVPLLVVEVVSDSTRRRDYVEKREFYIDAGIPDYWIVDGEDRTFRVVRPAADDLVTSTTLSWHPAGASEALVVDVEGVFREALG